MISKEKIASGSFGNYNCYLPKISAYNGSSSYSVITDNGALDVAQATEHFCLSAFIKTGSDITTTQEILGKLVFGNLVGRYGFYISDSKIYFQLQTTTTTYTLLDAITLMTDTEYHLFTHINKVTSEISFYIDGAFQRKTSYVGAISAMANSFEFYLGCANNATGSGTITYFGGHISDVRIYHKDVTNQLAKLINGYILSDEVLLVPNNCPEWSYDISDNHFHLSNNAVTYDYLSIGSSILAKYGYSLWQKDGSDDIQIAFDSEGNAIVPVVGTNIPAGYTKTRDISGNDVSYNMADSMIDFNPTGTPPLDIAILDRSSVTYQTATSRASIYYDVDHPYRYHISEITDYDTYSTFFNTDYKDMFFSKIIKNGTSIIRLDQTFVYSSKKTGDDLVKVKKYCRII